MNIADNVLAQGLKNVYFLSGDSCGGKSTVAAALGKEYGLYVYPPKDVKERLPVKLDSDFQPGLTCGVYRHPETYFAMSPERLSAYFEQCAREEADFILADLLRLSHDRPVLADVIIPVDILSKVADHDHIFFLFTSSEIKRRDYFCRKDKLGELKGIENLPNREWLIKNYLDALTYGDAARHEAIRNSGFRYIERTDSTKLSDLCAQVARHFGFDKTKSYWAMQKTDLHVQYMETESRAEAYNDSRPRIPKYAIDVISMYLGKRPQLVVDLGCGTGLSSENWLQFSDEVIGIDIDTKMLAIAKEKKNSKLHFIQAPAEMTGLPDSCADVVVCSQSFHWMEPEECIHEAFRILRPNGVFATIDYDWPPVTEWRIERAYMQLYQRSRELENTVPVLRSTVRQYPKDQHLKHFATDQYFTYYREVLFSNTEEYTQARLQELLLSQGYIQSAMSLSPTSVQQQIETLEDTINRYFLPNKHLVSFSYRMRIGIINK